MFGIHMKRLPLAALALVVGALATACPPPEGNEGEGEGETGGCANDRDCEGGSVCDKEEDGDGIPTADDPEGVCIKVFCISDDDCEDPVNEKCDSRRGFCIPRNLCEPGDPNACPTEGDKCIYEGGLPICKAPPAATACNLAPSPAYVVAGGTVQLEGVGTGAGNKLVPQTTFTWSVTGGGSIDAAGVYTAGATAGAATVTGTTENGGATCTATVNVLAAAADADLRIVVIDQATRAPLANSKVAVRTGAGTTSAVTAADGSATFAGAAAAAAVSIFPDAHQWHTILNPPDDVIMYTSPVPAADVAVDGIKGAFNFDNVHTDGDIRLGLAGTAINPAITDLNFNTIIGESIDTPIEIEGITDGEQIVPLPEGLIIGLGDTDFKGSYSSINDKAGPSVGWALAGQVKLSQIGDIIGSVAGDTENINAGAILAAVLPFFAKFDHAIVTGLDFDPAARQAGDPNFDTVEMKPETLLALDSTFEMPTLPCAPGALEGNACTGDVFKLEVGEESTIVTACPNPLPAGGTCEAVSPFATGAVILTGTVIPGIGLVPLGISAGLDDTSEDGNNFDGILEQSEDATPGEVLMDFAPPHDGIEGNLYMTVAIALDINSITSTDDIGASIVTQVSRSLPKTGNSFNNAFLQSQGGTFTPAAGTFALTKKGAADFYRVNFDNDGEEEWNVWFGGDEAGSFNIADLPVHEDIAAGDVTARTVHADVQAFKLGTGYDGPAPTSFDELFAFDGQDIDTLLYYLGAWSSESCKAGGLCNEAAAE